jgi:uncharacterized protein GlcG (DUF336 family)
VDLDERAVHGMRAPLDKAPGLLGAPAMDRLIPFGGGLPIVIDGEVVGGIGVSGGHWTDDSEIAEAALTAIR